MQLTRIFKQIENFTSRTENIQIVRENTQIYENIRQFLFFFQMYKIYEINDMLEACTN